MQAEVKESREMGQKSTDSGIGNTNMPQKPNTVKYFYFDKDGRQLSEETVEKLKINVKGNVALASGSGLAGIRTHGSHHRNSTLSKNVTKGSTQKTSLQQANMKIENSVKPEKATIPNFQASHNGQIYLVTPDGGLRSAVGDPEIRIVDDDQKKKQSKPKHMPGTNIEYRSNGTNYLNRNGKIKRPMNAFMLWAREFRGKLAEQMPNASNAEISVGLGQVWANLPATEKQYFYLEAERIKNQHRRDFPGWIYQPNITKRQNQKDAQHTRLWQRFVNNKEASGSKEADKESAFRPIAPATQQNHQSGDNITTSETTKAGDSKKPHETAPSTSSANSVNTQTKIEVKPAQNVMTLDQQKQQQESKIDAQTIQSTVKQVVVSSSSQMHNQSNPIPTFHQFKQELMSSEKLRNIASYVQKRPEVQSGERITQVPATSGNVVYQVAPFTTSTQTKTYPTTDFREPKLTNHVDRPGRPNSDVMKYNYIPGPKPISLIPTTKPLISSTAALPSTKQANQLSQPIQQKFLTLDTQRPQNQRSWTMMNQSVSQQKADPADQTSYQPKQTTRNQLQSNSSEHLQLPIAIPTLPNMNDRVDPLWPFPFPPVEQTPQTHLLYEGTVPDTVHSKTDLSDPYAPFYFDNYINHVRPTELQVDVNGWQQYLDEGNTNGTGKQSANYFSNVKQCPSDLEICPSPASQTLSRNQGSNVGTSKLVTLPASSDTSVNKRHKYLSLELDNGQQTSDFSLSSTRTPSSISVSHDGTTMQPSMSTTNQEIQEQQTEVIQRLPDTGGKSSYVPQEGDPEITPSSGNVNGNMVKNSGNYVTINPTYYADDTVYLHEPSSMQKNQEKTGSVEFGSIMSSAVNALHGDLYAYESTTVPGYNESSVPYMYSQSDVPPLYVQPSTSNESFQVSKYQVENNRPIKKRSYKIIEGLLENEVWMSQYRPKMSSSSASQSQCSVEMEEEAIVSNREGVTELNRDELFRENKDETKDSSKEELLEDKENETKDFNRGELLKDKENETKDFNRGELLEDKENETKDSSRGELLEDKENKTKDLNKDELLEDNKNKTEHEALNNTDQGDEEIGKTNEESSTTILQTAVCDSNTQFDQEYEPYGASNLVADTTGTLKKACSNEAETAIGEVISMNETEKGRLITSLTNKRETIKADSHELKGTPKETTGARNEDTESKASYWEYEDVEEQLDEKVESGAREVNSADLRENSEIKQDLIKKDKKEFLTNLQEDANMQNLEEESEDESKGEFQQFEIVIDNAEKMSSTSCEKLHLIQEAPSLKDTDEVKIFSNNISSSRMSEVLDESHSSEVDEKNAKSNSSDYLQQPEKIHELLNLVRKNKDGNLEEVPEHKTSFNKNIYPKGLPRFESGDAAINSKKTMPETEDTSASPSKTRNKRRRPYDSPVRMSKRQKQ